jgi:hypothetical protein
MLEIPALWRLRQVIWRLRLARPLSEFQARWCYIERPCLERKKEKRNTSLGYIFINPNDK